jgi:lambda family phage tail tape measure protein
VLKLFPGGSLLTAASPEVGAIGQGSSIFAAANGGAFAQNGIVPYAKGGIVNSPTLFKFAKGGSMATGVMGEAGPEAIMPLKRGPDGKLGVQATGGGGIMVNVNVDAKGTSVEGDQGQGQQLGRIIAIAVQSELIKQQRPGGVLNKR